MIWTRYHTCSGMNGTAEQFRGWLTPCLVRGSLIGVAVSFPFPVLGWGWDDWWWIACSLEDDNETNPGKAGRMTEWGGEEKKPGENCCCMVVCWGLGMFGIIRGWNKTCIRLWGRHMFQNLYLFSQSCWNEQSLSEMSTRGIEMNTLM